MEIEYALTTIPMTELSNPASIYVTDNGLYNAPWDLIDYSHLTFKNQDGKFHNFFFDTITGDLVFMTFYGVDYLLFTTAGFQPTVFALEFTIPTCLFTAPAIYDDNH
jgi:hypothetical protein